MTFTRTWLHLLGLCLIVLVALNCAAGTGKYSDTEPAGFWTGIWHGFISFFAFIIGLFSDSVRIYEPFNTGGWYDFGFIIGVSIFYSGSGHASRKPCKPKSDKEKEWEEIGAKVEEKVRTAVKSWVDEHENEEWAEIGRKIEEKIKRELRNWADR